jgi:hypothetical protein
MKTLLNPSAIKGVLYLCIVNILFVIIVIYTDVYRYALIGALYELLWLPMIVLVYLLPVIALIQIIGAAKTLTIKHHQLYAFVISLISILLLLTS